MMNFPHIPEQEKSEQWFLLIEPLAKVRLSRPTPESSKLLKALDKANGLSSWKSIKLTMNLALQHVTNADQIFSRASELHENPHPDGVIDDMFAEARTVPYLVLKGFKDIIYNRRTGLDYLASFNDQTYNIEVAYIRGPPFKTQKSVFIAGRNILELDSKKLISRLKTICGTKEKQVVKHKGNSSNTMIFVISDLDEMYAPWLNHDQFEGNHPLLSFVLSRQFPTVLFASGSVYEPSESALNKNFGKLRPFNWEEFKQMTFDPLL